jgi:hypothetical protein
MRKPPPIPDWLRAFRHPSYTNIYELCPNEKHVFGTETLFGDWDADLLLLAKDYAPSHIIRQRIKSGEDSPFRHGVRCKDQMGWRTNENLEKLAEEMGEVRLLYGSALGGLMRNDGATSGRLPDFTQLKRTFAARLLNWCIEHLPNLKGIACLGKDALKVVSFCSVNRPGFVGGSIS